ncbi:MAG: DUF420 domain-containing protein [Terriglobia bacterium]
MEAALNTTTAALLCLGYLSIRRKNIRAHKTFMLSAVATSAAFLYCYLWYHFHYGVIRFRLHGPIRTFYFTLLGTHTVLATVIVPLVIITLYRALRGRFKLHRKIARWTWPIWMYVSVTGVVVYWMLYRLPGAR